MTKRDTAKGDTAKDDTAKRFIANRRTTSHSAAERGARRPTPKTPAALPAGSWWGAVKRSIREYKKDNLSDWAAALTYYGVLSIFPAMLVMVSLIGLAGTSVSEDLINNVGETAPGAVRQVLVNALTELQRGRGGAGLVALLALAAAIWSASGYVAAFMRASNAVYDVP